MLKLIAMLTIVVASSSSGMNNAASRCEPRAAAPQHGLCLRLHGVGRRVFTVADPCVKTEFGSPSCWKKKI